MPFLAIPAPSSVQPEEVFSLGASRSPSGAEIRVDRMSLRLDGARWMPVMGELHYARVPAADWREELLKMRAGGIDCVASYVFWIHHEESEGEFGWSGDRGLRRFVATAAECGLRVVVRLGPWCHGEVRNGGLPDWIVSRHGARARTDDPAYLASVRALFAQIFAQLDGLLWKQGGPIVGFQIENEYWGPAEHLLTLKRLARKAGLDAPLYTRTGWPDLTTPMPFGELLPLYGAYPEGFWDRDLAPMPGFYPASFRFTPLRTDAGIATDLLGQREAADTPGTERYPFLTCELGGGMMSSYHRRIRIDPRDIESLVHVKLGSGGNLPGYYMYHGGVNPEGRTTLQESQATGYWNDLPVKNYDFQAPLGAAGQLRPHYHRLRRLHLFIRDHGSLLAGLPAHFPADRKTSPDDLATLRWSVRSDGRSGFVFINNYERLRPLPAKPGVRFAFDLPDGRRVEFPSVVVDIPADSTLVWPFGLPLAPGVHLDHATARLLCQIDEGAIRTVFFAATPGVPAEFAFDGAAPEILAPGRRVARVVPGADGATVRIVLLDDADSLALWKADWLGRPRVFLSRAALVFDGDTLRVSAENPADLAVSVFPALAPSESLFTPLPLHLAPHPSGINHWSCQTSASNALEDLGHWSLVISPLRPAGPAREIPLGHTQPAVAVAPTDADFAHGAAWRVALPADLDPARTPLLRLRYVGDVARILLGGRLVLDDFYHGDVLELDLARHASALATGADLVVEILPLRADAPILLPAGLRPPADSAPLAHLHSVELVPRFSAIARLC